MREKMKFAIIGCGRIANWHADAIKNMDEAELVSVCDIVEEKAKAFGETHKVKHYVNYNRMLCAENIDVVNIITPSGMHAEHAIDIMDNYKKHIVVEKPMALKIKDCEDMMNAADRNKVSLHVVFQNRFNKAVSKIREAVDNGKFGRFVLGTVRLRWCRPQRYYDRDAWRGKWAFDGGALTNQAIHHIDLLRWLFGDVDMVSAKGGTRLADIEVEDTAVAWLHFKNGALGAIEATTAARPDDFEASISILGENGTVIVEGASVNKITTWTFDDIDKEKFSETPPTVYGFGHLPLLKGVVKSIRNGTPSPIGGDEGLKTIKLLNAIYSSIEMGVSVRLSDNPVSSKLGVITKKDEKIRSLYVTPKL